MFQKKYKSGDLYIKPNGIWMSTKIENPSDNSSLGSINQRKYYSQTIVLTVKGWIIDPDDFIIEKGITRVVNDIYIDTLSNKSKVNVIQNENQSIFNLLLKDNLPQPVIEIQYKNYNDFIIKNLIMNENITSYEIFSYGNKLFDNKKNSLPITISGGDKIVFRLIKDDIIDNLKLEFESEKANNKEQIRDLLIDISDTYERKKEVEKELVQSIEKNNYLDNEIKKKINELLEKESIIINLQSELEIKNNEITELQNRELKYVNEIEKHKQTITEFSSLKGMVEHILDKFRKNTQSND